MFSTARPVPDLQSPPNFEVTLMGTSVLMCSSSGQMLLELNTEQARKLHDLVRDLPGQAVDSKEAPLKLFGGRELWEVKVIDAGLDGAPNCQVQSVSVGLSAKSLTLAKDGISVSLKLEEDQLKGLRDDMSDLLSGLHSQRIAHHVHLILSKTDLYLRVGEHEVHVQLTALAARELHKDLHTLDGFRLDSRENPITPLVLDTEPRRPVPALRDLSACEVDGISVAQRDNNVVFLKNREQVAMSLSAPDRILFFGYVIPSLIEARAAAEASSRPTQLLIEGKTDATSGAIFIKSKL